MNNRILKSLPHKEYRILSAQLKPVTLQKGVVLHEAGERTGQVYFPDEAMISYLSGTAEGETLEVCVVGNEGVVGLALLLSDLTAFHAIVQIPGVAFSMSRDLLRRDSSDVRYCTTYCFVTRTLSSFRSLRRRFATSFTPSNSVFAAGCSWPTSALEK